MHEQMDESTAVWKDALVDECSDGCMDTCVNGWLDECMDGGVIELMDRQTYIRTHA